jgi:peroxiredoxin family protein
MHQIMTTMKIMEQTTMTTLTMGKKMMVIMTMEAVENLRLNLSRNQNLNLEMVEKVEEMEAMEEKATEETIQMNLRIAKWLAEEMLVMSAAEILHLLYGGDDYYLQ